MYDVFGSASPTRSESPNYGNGGAYDAAGDQFRRAVVDRKKTESELSDLRRQVMNQEEVISNLRDEMYLAKQAASGGEVASSGFHRRGEDASSLLLLQQIPELKAEVESERRRRQDLENTLVEEKNRIERQMEEYHSTIGRRLMDTERERDRLSMLLLEKEQEIIVKDAELRSSHNENGNTQENMERVVKDLVERNKRHDEASAIKYQQYDAEIRRLKQEQLNLVEECREYRDQVSKIRNECVVLSSQCDTAQSVNQDVAADLQSAQMTANNLAMDLQEAKMLAQQKDEVITMLRDENGSLLERIDRLEMTMRNKADEDIIEAEKYAQARVQYATLEDELAEVNHNSTEFIAKVTLLVSQVYEESRKVLAEADSSRESFLDIIRSKDDMSQAYRRDDELPLEPMDAEETTLEYLARCADNMVVIWEEIHALKMDTRHELLRREEYARQVEVLREAYDVDHTHIAELNGRIQQLNSQVTVAEREKETLQESLADSDRWMDEAVKCTEEQKRRNEHLMGEKDRIQTEFNFLRQQYEALNTTYSEKENELVITKTHMDRITRENWDLQRMKSNGNEDGNKLRDTVVTLRCEMDSLSRALKRAQEELTSSREKSDLLEKDVRFLRQQNEEFSHQKQSRQQESDKLERDNRKLRDDLVICQRTLQELNSKQPSSNSMDNTFKELIREKEKQMDQLRRQRDDADGKAMRLADENARMKSRLERDGNVSTNAHKSTRGLSSTEKVKELESRVTQLLSSKEIDSWRFK